MQEFVVEAPPARIFFGPGCIKCVGATEIRKLGLHRLLVLGSHRALTGTPALVELQAAIKDLVVGVIQDVEWYNSPEALVDKANEVSSVDADGLLVIGGGSPLGLAKALAQLMSQFSPSRLAIVSIPTTYSGSEVTAYHGIHLSADGMPQKFAIRNRVVRPLLVLYDAQLLLGLPRALAISSSFNALAHAFEALWVSRTPSPQSQRAAKMSIETIFKYLPALDTTDQESEEGLEVVNELLHAAYLGAHSLDTEDLGLQHQLAHVLIGTYNLPHAEAHMLLLPHVIHFYEETWAGAGKNTTPLTDIQLPLTSSPMLGMACHVFDFQRTLLRSQPPLNLKDLGLQESDLEGVIDTLIEYDGLSKDPEFPWAKPALLILLQHAWAGDRPLLERHAQSPQVSSVPKVPRVSYLSNDDFRSQDPEAAAKIVARRQGNLLNLDRVLMHAPAVAQGWNAMFGSLRSGLQLIDGRLRELVILRVAVLNRAYYEYFQHYPVLLAEGGTVAEAEALGDWQGEAARGIFGDRDKAVLAYVDEMTRHVQVQQATAETLRAVLPVGNSESYMVELTALCAGYNMVSRFLEALQLTPETTNLAELPHMPVDVGDKR
ncbi:maleylacetate reductase [Nannochloropsis oceanica]